MRRHKRLKYMQAVRSSSQRIRRSKSWYHMHEVGRSSVRVGPPHHLSAAKPTLDCMPPGQPPAAPGQLPSTGGIAPVFQEKRAAKHSETTPKRNFQHSPSSVASDGPRALRDPGVCRGDNPSLQPHSSGLNGDRSPVLPDRNRTKVLNCNRKPHASSCTPMMLQLCTAPSVAGGSLGWAPPAGQPARAPARIPAAAFKRQFAGGRCVAVQADASVRQACRFPRV